MLDKEDLKAIGELIAQSEARTAARITQAVSESEERTAARITQAVSESEARTAARITQAVSESEARTAKAISQSENRMKTLIDLEVTPKFNLLAENQAIMMEQISEIKETIEPLDTRVTALELAVKKINRELRELKKAQ